MLENQKDINSVPLEIQKDANAIMLITRRGLSDIVQVLDTVAIMMIVLNC